MSRANLLRLVMLAAIWGGSFLLMRIAVPSLGTATTAGGRLLVGAIAVLAWLVVLRRPLGWGRHWKHFLWNGALNSGLPFLCFAYAAHHIPAGHSAVMTATTPLFTVLFAWFVSGLRPSVSKLLGVVVGIVGVATLVRFGAPVSTWAALTAYLAVLCAAAMLAAGALVVQKYSAPTDPDAVAAGSLSAAALLTLPAIAFAPPGGPITVGPVLALLGLGLLCTGLAYAQYFRLLREAGSERAVTVTLLIPVFAQCWSAMFLHESLTWAAAIGGALVLSAVVLVFEWIPWPRPAPVAVAGPG
jgi:drug/metabolite transporter (DMT)-like permease